MQEVFTAESHQGPPAQKPLSRHWIMESLMEITNGSMCTLALPRHSASPGNMVAGGQFGGVWSGDSRHGQGVGWRGWISGLQVHTRFYPNISTRTALFRSLVLHQQNSWHGSIKAQRQPAAYREVSKKYLYLPPPC